MYSPSLQYALVQTHIEDLHRARQATSARPITTKHRAGTRFSTYVSRAIERFFGQVSADAPAFEGRP